MTYQEYLAERDRRQFAYEQAQARGRQAVLDNDWRGMVAAQKECSFLWTRILDLSVIIHEVNDWPEAT